MKKLAFLTVVLSILGGLTACGPSQDDPTKKYRDQGLVPADKAHVNDPKIEYRYIEKRDTVFITVDPNDARGTSGDGQVVLQNSFFRVDHETNLNFTEGKAGEIEFTVKFIKGKVDFVVDDSGLPSGAKLETVSNSGNSGKYKLSWTPKAGTIKSGELSFEGAYEMAFKSVKFEKADDQKAFDALALKTRSIPFVVRKDDKKPTLKVVDLGDARQAGEVHKFTVEVTAPAGYKGEPLTPEIIYDTTNLINSSGMVEQNGGYFITIDPQNPAGTQVSAGKWVFHYVFDTKNVDMLPQFDKNFKEVSNATKLYVRVSFKVSSEKVAVSDKTTLQFFINL